MLDLNEKELEKIHGKNGSRIIHLYFHPLDHCVETFLQTFAYIYSFAYRVQLNPAITDEALI